MIPRANLVWEAKRTALHAKKDTFRCRTLQTTWNRKLTFSVSLTFARLCSSSSTCPSGLFNAANKCLKCNDACLNCTGPSNSMCITCNTNYQRVGNNICKLPECGDGFRTGFSLQLLLKMNHHCPKQEGSSAMMAIRNLAMAAALIARSRYFDR